MTQWRLVEVVVECRGGGAVEEGWRREESEQHHTHGSRQAQGERHRLGRGGWRGRGGGGVAGGGIGHERLQIEVIARTGRWGVTLSMLSVAGVGGVAGAAGWVASVGGHGAGGGEVARGPSHRVRSTGPHPPHLRPGLAH